MIFLLLQNVKYRNLQHSDNFLKITIYACLHVIFDIITVYTVNHLETVPGWLNWICHMIFFMVSIMFIKEICSYVVKFIFSKKQFNLVRKITKGIIFLYIVIMPFMQLDYLEGRGTNYSMGMAVYLGYGIFMVYCCVASGILIVYRKKIDPKVVHNVLPMMLIMISVVLIQAIVPEMLFTSAGITFVSFGIFVSLESPTEIYKSKTYALEKEKAIAEEANRIKSDFLARMSHEIRTPINSVLGMDEMILRDSKEADTKVYALNIKSSATSLLGLINDILDSSKIESGKMEIIEAEFHLDEFLNDICNMIAIKASEKGLKFEVLIDEHLPNGWIGDSVRIRQILLNLLSNAVKYTTKGKVTLKICGCMQDEVCKVHFEVRDTGKGIKEEDLPKLFTAFKRIEELENRHIEGTGLGMSIVVNLLQMMNSKLEVDSVYGEGSTFSFDLEQKIFSIEEIGNFKEKIKKVSKEYTYQVLFTAPDAKILVVDDNDINRKVFTNLLKETQVQITDVNSGKACLDVIQKEHFDLIFMDHMMPEMDGVETFQKMQNMTNQKCMDTPVVILTANAMVGAREQYLEQGFVDFLSKPIQPDKLENLTMTLLIEQGVSVNQDVEAKEREASFTDEVELPDIAEFDWDYAGMYLKDKKILLQTVKDYYLAMGNNICRIQQLFEHIVDENGLAEYRIFVHGLKSTSASVGALILSKLARLLEIAAIDGDIQRIQTLHPVFLEELKTHKQRLSPFFEVKKEEKTESGDMGQLKLYLEELCECLKDWDYDQADAIMEQINQYTYEETVGKKIELLSQQVMELEAEAAIGTIEDIFYMKLSSCI